MSLRYYFVYQIIAMKWVDINNLPYVFRFIGFAADEYSAPLELLVKRQIHNPRL